MQNKEWPTDKYKSGLIPAYERLFAGLRAKPVKYVEMGILYGGSLLWAKEFFASGSTIIGLDREIKSKPIDGVEMLVIDQADTQGLETFGRDRGPFDIVIDDGSHVRDLTASTFNGLYQFVAPGGLYIIEDWGAGYFPQFAHCKGMETLATDMVWQYGGQVVRLSEGGSYAAIFKK